jgi:ABC-type sugar transport system ATPase subunit
MMEINIHNVSKNYGFNNILKEINLSIQKGEKVSLIGSNGCGKTTLLKIISGIENPTEGEVSIRKVVL